VDGEFAAPADLHPCFRRRRQHRFRMIKAEPQDWLATWSRHSHDVLVQSLPPAPSPASGRKPRGTRARHPSRGLSYGMRAIRYSEINAGFAEDWILDRGVAPRHWFLLWPHAPGDVGHVAVNFEAAREQQLLFEISKHLHREPAFRLDDRGMDCRVVLGHLPPPRGRRRHFQNDSVRTGTAKQDGRPAACKLVCALGVFSRIFHAREPHPFSRVISLTSHVD